MRLLNLYNTRLNRLPGLVNDSSMRTVDPSESSAPFFAPNMDFEGAYLQSGGDPVDDMAYAYQYAAEQAMSEYADPASMPSLGRLYSGAMVREASLGGRRKRPHVWGVHGTGLGSAASDKAALNKLNQCRAQLAQTPPEYIDAMVAFVIAAIIRTPTALAQRVVSLFGKDAYDCLFAVAQADTAALSTAEKAAHSEQLESVVQWLYGKAGLPAPKKGTFLKDASKRFGSGALIALTLWSGAMVRHNGDTKKVNAMIEHGLRMEDKHQWNANWKASWDKLIAPWYENPVYLGVGGVAVLAGVWWLSGRK